MMDLIRLVVRGFGWRLGALAAVAFVALVKHYL